MDVIDSLVDAVGRTPLVRLNRVTEGLSCPVYAKVEYLNPGGSVKDRIALSMVEDAEARGLLRPGSTIVEATSGNTGVGLAMVAAQRGYRCVFVIPDKSSAEKIAVLRAYGAEVLVCPGNVPIGHPEHVRSVSERVAAETPGAWLSDQYNNAFNPLAHYRSTGPEIWRQTDGRVTHFVAGVGTGGTITGTARYLKEVSQGRVTVVGADPESSVYAGGEGRPYFVESVGHFRHPETTEDLWPDAYDQDLVDLFERVSDRESLLTARDLARREGLLVGGSAGTAVVAALRVAARLGPDDLVVVLLPDSGRIYLSKVFDDGWMRHYGFLDHEGDGPAVRDLLERVPPRDRFPHVHRAVTVREALEALDGVPHPVPVVTAKPPVVAPEVAGSVSAAGLRLLLGTGGADPSDPVGAHLEAPPPAVGAGEPADVALDALKAAEVVVVLVDGRAEGLLTRKHVR
ncbi:pyridoxal-phosphate dependent enzyme [Streptosporangium saharense]|uniref:pyridoxal-phosphate dependent enzyme n=1 Tax=Streptosporangium saharense TaxID=1706840 RepID=UPI00368B09AB